MRIISKFKDYYDYNQKFGYDNIHTYNRVEEQITTTEHNKVIGELYNMFLADEKCFETKSVVRTESFPYVICIGESVFWFYKILYINWGVAHPETTYFHITEDYIKKVIKSKTKNWHWYTNDFQDILTKVKSNYFNDICVKYKVPIIKIEEDHIILNPCLEDCKFYKTMDGYELFQEVEMFIGNQLAHDVRVDVPVGDDKCLARSKGFNKMSFRKEKE